MNYSLYVRFEVMMTTIVLRNVTSCSLAQTSQNVEATSMLQIGRSLVRSQMVSLEFFIDIKSFRSHYGPEVDSASNRNEYQEHFLGVKVAGT